MDVSPVSMATPKIIDWRKLTAKDIIKYDNEGMNVPSEYLSWARSFIVDLEKNDTDETTYEMAISKPENLAGNMQNPNPQIPVPANNTKETYKNQQNATPPENNGTPPTTNTPTQNTQDTENITSTEEQDTENGEDVSNTDENALTAEEKKEKLELDGEGLFSIAKSFQQDSDTKAENSNKSSNTVNALGEASDNAIASLDSYMNNLIGQADELSSKINTTKNKQDKQENDFVKLLKLQQELKDLGMTGQNVTIGYDTDLNTYQTAIDEGTTIGLDAQDYGNVTIDLGKEVKRRWIRLSLGVVVENSGKNAVSAGQNSKDTSSLVSDRNNANLNIISDHQGTINNKTGVSVADVARENPNSQQQNSQNPNNTGNKTGVNTPVDTKPKTGDATIEDKQPQPTPLQKAADKNDTTTDDKKTEVEKKEEKIASGNLDEILKRKLRKGEQV